MTQEDLSLALHGKFVTRVIYVEDPRNALPSREIDKSQNWFEAAPGQDPLAVADTLGRPVAILRLGGRLPDPSADKTFFFGSPPYVPCPPPAVVPAEAEGRAAGREGSGRSPAAVPLPSARRSTCSIAGETAAMNPTSLPWPRFWRLAVIAFGVLILCSCRSAVPPPVDLSGVRSSGYAMLPPEAVHRRAGHGRHDRADGSAGHGKRRPRAVHPDGSLVAAGH